MLSTVSQTTKFFASRTSRRQDIKWFPCLYCDVTCCEKLFYYVINSKSNDEILRCAHFEMTDVYAGLDMYAMIKVAAKSDTTAINRESNALA